MDGHDNDDSGANSAGSTQGGIFSTPDLTVSAENVTQPAQDDERKRVASIFANTDTGRQAQRLNDAMEAQTTPTTEDVVIPNGSRNKSKLPLILVAIILVGAVIGFVVWMVMKNIPSAPAAPKTAREAFDVYSDLLRNGPENLRENATADQWFFFQVDDGGFTNTDVAAYIKSLDEAYTNFDKLAVNQTDEETGALLSNYKTSLSLWSKYVSLPALKQRILELYIDNKDGKAEASAFDYVTQITEFNKNDSSDEMVEFAYESLKDYLSAELDLLNLYNDWGCINKTFYTTDMVCIDEHSNGSIVYSEFLSKQDASLSFLGDYMGMLYDGFVANTNTLIEKYGEKDA